MVVESFCLESVGLKVGTTCRPSDRPLGIDRTVLADMPRRNLGRGIFQEGSIFPGQNGSLSGLGLGLRQEELSRKVICFQENIAHFARGSSFSQTLGSNRSLALDFPSRF